MDYNKRIPIYDFIRCIAIICVISIHDIEGLSYWDVLTFNSTLNYCDWIVQTIIYIIGRLGVPFFLMLTGTLTLSHSFDSNNDIISYFKNKVLPLYFVTVAWIFIYFLAYQLKSFTLLNILKFLFKSLFLDSSSGLHLWYMPMIIGIYIFIPIISKIVKCFSSKFLLVYCIIVLFMSSVLPTVWLFLQINNLTKFNISTLSNIQSGFTLSIYPIYCILGYLCTKEKIFKYVKTHLLILIVCISLISLIALQFQCYYLKVRTYGHYLSYINIFIVIISICLFELLGRVFIDNHSRLIYFSTNISKLSFGIYLIHIIFLYAIMDNVKQMSACWELKYLLLFVFTFLTSFLFSYIIKKIPVLKRLVTL